jgi:hypothetical protein
MVTLNAELFMALLQHDAITTEENLKGLNQYRWYFGIDTNQVPVKWETAVRIAALHLTLIKVQ